MCAGLGSVGVMLGSIRSVPGGVQAPMNNRHCITVTPAKAPRNNNIFIFPPCLSLPCNCQLPMLAIVCTFGPIPN